MDIKQEKINDHQIKLIVNVLLDEFKKFLDKAAQDISENVNIKGFRKGKVPYDVLKKNIGEMEIYQEAAQKFINSQVDDILAKEKVIFVGQPQIEILKLVPENPFEFSVLLDLMPKVELPDKWKEIKVKLKKNKVETKKVESFINDLALSYSKQAAKTGSAQKGDNVVLDFELKFDNVVPEDGVAKNFSVTLGENKMIPGFEEKLLSVKAGDEKVFSLHFPKEYFNKKYADKTGEFKVKVKQVFAIEKPELNDDFAKNFQLNSFAELKEQVTKRLQSDQDMKDLNEAEVIMFEKLIEIANISHIPENLIKSEKDKMIFELKQNIVSQGLKFEDYLQHIKKTEDELKEFFTPDAVKRLKTSLVVNNIREKENISVSQSEVEKEIEHMLSHYTDDNIKKQIDSPRYRNYLRGVMETKKVAQFIKDNILEQ